MPGTYSHVTRTAVLDAMSETEGLYPREIHAKLDYLAIGTVKNLLAGLVDEGLARSEGQLAKRRYFRVPGATVPVAVRRTQGMTDTRRTAA